MLSIGRTVFIFILGLLVFESTASEILTEQPPLLRTVSPDGHIEVDILLEANVSYSVRMDGNSIIEKSALGLLLESQGDLGQDPQLERTESRDVRRTVRPTLPTWQAEIPDHFQERTIFLKNGLQIILRVANDGVALRFGTDIKGPITVVKEIFELRTDRSALVTAPMVSCSPNPPEMFDCFHDSYEHPYETNALGDLTPQHLAQVPLVIQSQGAWLALYESNVSDYPGSWITFPKANTIALTAPGAPKKVSTETLWKWKFQAVIDREDHLVSYSAGRHTLPWRVIQIAKSETDLIARDFPARLADEGLAEAATQDWNWLTPGFATDEWIIDARLQLDPFQTGFISGLNTSTYKYYIDFAARAGFKFIIIDDGWADPDDLRQRTPEISIPQLVRYGAGRGVGLLIWVQSHTLISDLDRTLDYLKRMGAAGLKIDFFQRDDVDAIRFQERIAKAAAARRLHVLFHGTTKPSGLEFRYPNILSYEAGLGHEFNKGSYLVSPQHKLHLAFIRSLVGPFDYEGGSMLNAQPELFQIHSSRVQAQGTRVNELSLNLIYPGALQVLAGDPAAYQSDPKILDFYTDLPTVWDETRVLHAEFNHVLALARRKDRVWYIAVLSADNKKRGLILDFSFLEPGQHFLTALSDGPQADVHARDYRSSALVVDASTQLHIDLARNGGWVGKIHLK